MIDTSSCVLYLCRIAIYNEIYSNLNFIINDIRFGLSILPPSKLWLDSFSLFSTFSVKIAEKRESRDNNGVTWGGKERPLHTTPTRATERGYFTASPRQDRMTYFNRLLLSRGASTAVLISNRKSLVDRPANPHPSRSGRARFASVA